MNTPIYDFVKGYSLSGTARFHMPGHKGRSFLGCEDLDITEICGADVLYHPNGIIAESEKNASSLFGSYHTFYSAEGSTLAIKVMLALATMGCNNEQPLILAARNSHKAFVHACALLDISAEWIILEERNHLCACNITAEGLENSIRACSKKPCAVYVTSPDYMGNILDIASLSKVCHDHGIPLLVDNAHGSYLAFTEPPMHPLALGADLCCDSAHKTLPVLTGGAYLHISKKAPDKFKNESTVRNTFSLFASTSPSYLILSSLDLCNRYIADGYKEKLRSHIDKLSDIKSRLSAHGYDILPSEPLKTVISCASYGYRGCEISDILRDNHIECEFSDNEYIVFMSTPENSQSDLERLCEALTAVQRKAPIEISKSFLLTARPTAAISIRKAILSLRETVSVKQAIGRICATPTVSCPPAIPIVISGEVITKEHVELFMYYGIDKVEVCII